MSFSFFTMIPSSSPIALNTFKTSSSDAPVRSTVSSSMSISSSSMSNSSSSSSPMSNSSSSISDSSSSMPISSSSISNSSSAPASSMSTSSSSSSTSTCSLRDSFTNSLISSFMVERSTPFTFSCRASSKFRICKRASSTVFLLFSIYFYRVFK